MKVLNYVQHFIKVINEELCRVIGQKWQSLDMFKIRGKTLKRITPILKMQAMILLALAITHGLLHVFNLASKH